MKTPTSPLTDLSLQPKLGRVRLSSRPIACANASDGTNIDGTAQLPPVPIDAVFSKRTDGSGTPTPALAPRFLSAATQAIDYAREQLERRHTWMSGGFGIAGSEENWDRLDFLASSLDLTLMRYAIIEVEKIYRPDYVFWVLGVGEWQVSRAAGQPEVEYLVREPNERYVRNVLFVLETCDGTWSATARVIAKENDMSPWLGTPTFGPVHLSFTPGAAGPLTGLLPTT